MLLTRFTETFSENELAQLHKLFMFSFFCHLYVMCGLTFEADLGLSIWPNYQKVVIWLIKAPTSNT